MLLQRLHLTPSAPDHDSLGDDVTGEAGAEEAYDERHHPEQRLRLRGAHRPGLGGAVAEHRPLPGRGAGVRFGRTGTGGGGGAVTEHRPLPGHGVGVRFGRTGRGGGGAVAEHRPLPGHRVGVRLGRTGTGGGGGGAVAEHRPLPGHGVGVRFGRQSRW